MGHGVMGGEAYVKFCKGCECRTVDNNCRAQNCDIRDGEMDSNHENPPVEVEDEAMVIFRGKKVRDFGRPIDGDY